MESAGTVRLKLHQSRQSAELTSLLQSLHVNTLLEKRSVTVCAEVTAWPVAKPAMSAASGSAGQEPGNVASTCPPSVVPTMTGRNPRHIRTDMIRMGHS